MKNKVVYNACYGGYTLSNDVYLWMAKHGISKNEVNEMERHNPLLVQCIEELGSRANTSYSCLQVEEIEGCVYRIEEYDGWETVVTPEDVEWITIY